MKRTRIAILGGGPGGLSAAWHLARQQRDDLEITVYTMGWRIGGKGAAGRNFAHSQRIEEHGIHLFGNFYPNTFGVMKEVRTVGYEDFIPSNLQIRSEWYRGRWFQYPTRFAHVGEEPWQKAEVVDADDLADKVLMQTREILRSGWTLRWSRFRRLRRLLGRSVDETSKPWPPLTAPPLVSFLGLLIEPLVKRMAKRFARTDGFTEEPVPPPPPGAPPRHPYPLALRLVMSVFQGLGRLSPRVRDQFLQVDALMALLHGFLVDRLFERGIDAVDAWDHRVWLRDHGISDETLDSAVVAAAPNICLQFPGGDSTKPASMSAAGYLTFALRQLLAGGNALHFFRAGTGETVFLPWYERCVELGVKFEFFHKVRDVVPSADGSRIERVEFDIQAKGKDGTYEPLCTAKDGQVVWDANTPYDKLERGEEMRERGVNLESWWADWDPVDTRTLLADEDFDQIVMAIPVGAHPYACPSLVEQGPPAGKDGHDWKTMVEGLETIPSQAVQIWLKDDIASYGMDPALLQWRGERFAGPSYSLPLNLWTDFSDLIPIEDWSGTVPRTLIYWCGPMQDEGIPDFDDHDFPERQRRRILYGTAQDFRGIGPLLPGCTNPADRRSMDFDQIVCDGDGPAPVGEQRLWAQHLRANVDPNERYVISKPGSITYRRQAWESGYPNMALAGDWIFTGINIGSFEGAVMSGKLASHALTADPPLEDVWGYAFLRNRREGENVPMIRDRPGPEAD